MTTTEGQEQNQSAFNQRSDSAALVLKGQLSQELSAMTGRQVVLPSRPVPVNEQGQPVSQEQLPPEGSYARQALEQQRAARSQQEALEQHQRATDPGAFQTAPAAAQPHEAPEQLSARAQERINSLVSQLRQKDQDYQQLQAAQAQSSTTLEELKAQLTASQQQLQNFMQQHLEALDPETRAQVMMDSRLQQQLALSEQRIMQAIAPRLEALQVNNDQRERQQLADVYPGYDPLTHDPLIDAFRRANRACSVEQAFRAVATPEELRVGARPANAPPPTVPPGNGSQQPRYMPQQSQQTDPVAQLRADAAEAARLSRSLDPNDQKLAQQLWHKNLADRLGF